jgi:hypothetical protein
MHGHRASDSFIVPRKPSNKGRSTGPAEKVEGRELAKGIVAEQTRSRTLRRGLLSHALSRVRQALSGACASRPEAGARCGSAARRDLCGGCWVTGIPTATPFRYRDAPPPEAITGPPVDVQVTLDGQKPNGTAFARTRESRKRFAC